MIFPLQNRNRKREFNPFNLKEETGDDKFHVKFDRLPGSLKVRSIWWLFIVLAFAFYVFWYLRTNY